MAYTRSIVTFGLLITAPSLAAAQGSAPPGNADTRYCMRIELTGNLVEPLRCWTRDQWADQGVDVDKEWPKEGVRVIG